MTINPLTPRTYACMQDRDVSCNIRYVYLPNYWPMTTQYITSQWHCRVYHRGRRKNSVMSQLMLKRSYRIVLSCYQCSPRCLNFQMHYTLHISWFCNITAGDTLQIFHCCHQYDLTLRTYLKQNHCEQLWRPHYLFKPMLIFLNRIKATS